MTKLYRTFRGLVGRTLHGLHPRSIAWEIKHARGSVHPIITPLGWDGHLKVRIYSTDLVGKTIYQRRVMEPREVLLITRFLRPGMSFFDFGANFGQYTVLAAQRVGAAGSVHSFEPSSRMFQELSFNVALNKLEGRCTLNQVALSDTLGSAKLSRYETGAEVFGSLGTHHRRESSPIGFEEVATTTLDAYVAEHGIRRVDLIKMDIEGAELLALRGGEGLLRRPDAPAIVLEMADVNTVGFGYHAVDTWDFLESMGYQMFSFKNRRATLVRALRPRDFQAYQDLLAVKCRFDLWGITDQK